MIFGVTQKYELRVSFISSEIQMLWRQEMPKHVTQNILQNNLESKHSLLMKTGQFM